MSVALDAAVETGDTLFDLLVWLDDDQRTDAWLQRRVVVLLSGIGDLVARRGEDPADIDCLRRIDRQVAAIREGLRQRSHQLASIAGALPALAERQPGADWTDGGHWRTWRRRWQKAFEETMLRHRTLLVMSPYAVLPSEPRVSSAYADLLPALAHADALAFAGGAAVSHWNLNEFRGFHQRVLGVVERQNAASFVATGV